MSAKKVMREVRRLLLQIGGLPKAVTYDPARRLYYDWVQRGQISRSDGALSLGSKVAIYLIFPKNGLLGSHLAALDYLIQSGYAPLVVSNVPLSDEDKATVLDRCWRYLERPNFGYDFGGYRDGVLDLAPDLPGLSRLVILNDSVWFPLPGAADWLRAAETSGLDFAAACSHATIYQMKGRRKSPRGAPPLTEYQALKWDYRYEGNRRFHYVSFAQSLGPNVLQHPGFLTYWTKLKLSNSKPRTVRRGEIGFTRWVIGAGLSHGATLDAADLPEQLSALDTPHLRQIAETAFTFGEKRTSRIVAAALRAPDLDRSTLIQLILLTVARQGISYAIPTYTVPLGHAFLKKSPVWEDKRASDITLHVIHSLEGPFARIILSEAMALRPFPPAEQGP